MTQIIGLPDFGDSAFSATVTAECDDAANIHRVFNAIIANPTDQLPVDPGCSIVGIVKDLSLIALGWGVFVAMITHPAMQLAGLLACSIALVITAEKLESNAKVRGTVR